MAAKYKLMYFNIRGRAEVIRWIFAQAGQEYEDYRFDREEWSTLKPKTLFGQVPVLEVNGKQMAQTKAVARFLAKRFGLVGDTDLDQARGDMIADYVDDMATPVGGILYEQNEDKKAKLQEKFLKEHLPVCLGNYEKILKENDNGDGYFVGQKVTWTDLYVVSIIEWMMGAGLGFKNDILNNFPKLKALKNRVQELPAIAKWMKERPVTEL